MARFLPTRAAVPHVKRGSTDDRAARTHGPRDEDGQGLAEYALILAIVAIIALIFLGSQISEKLSQVGKSI